MIDQQKPRSLIANVLALPRTIWLLGAISLLNDAASDMIYPLVPLYLASVLMAGPKALGVIEGVAEAVSSILKLVAGVLADRSGRTRAWVIAGYGIAGFARPLIGLATSWIGVLAWVSRPTREIASAIASRSARPNGFKSPRRATRPEVTTSPTLAGASIPRRVRWARYPIR